MTDSRLLGKHHQRSSSTGSHGLLFGIGAAAGPHHIYHQPLTHQASSQSTDPLTDEEEDDDIIAIGTPPDLKGNIKRFGTKVAVAELLQGRTHPKGPVACVEIPM